MDKPLISVFRVQLDLNKLRLELFKESGVGSTKDHVERWLQSRGIWQESDHWLAEETMIDRLPPGIVVNRVTPAETTDDSRYLCVFREVEKEWARCAQVGTAGILLEEFVADDGNSCVGPVVRAWERNASGLHGIDEANRLAHHALNSYGSIYPFVLMQFRIGPAANRVVGGVTHGSRSGFGGVFLVNESELLPEPDGNWWVS